MKSYKRTIVTVALVAAVSSGVSIFGYAYLSSKFGANTLSTSNGNSTNGFSNFVRVLNSSPQNTDFTAVAAKSVNAVVSIKATVTPKSNQQNSSQRYQDPFLNFFFGPGQQQQTPQQRPQVGMGSGVIISDDGYIITNNHVINDADKIEVTLNDKRQFNAKLIGSDPATDLALLKIEATDLPMMAFGDSESLQVGEWVLAVGNPMGLNSTVTAGIVSAKGRSIGAGKSLSIESYIQTDAAVNPGNSGGALVNTNGDLIGINTLILSQTGNYIGYSFAVPSNIAIKIVSDIKEFGSVQRALLGVTIIEMSADLAKEKGVDFVTGVYVEGLTELGSAITAGVKKGDIIVAINGEKVTTVSKLQEEINTRRPGDTVKVSVIRDGKSVEIDILLKNQQGDTSITKSLEFASLGVGLNNLDRDELQSLGITSGVKVIAVNDGKFKKAGIREGFVILNINGEITNSIDTIERIYNEIQKSSSRNRVMFITGIYPNGKSAYYAVDLSE